MHEDESNRMMAMDGSFIVTLKSKSDARRAVQSNRRGAGGDGVCKKKLRLNGDFLIRVRSSAHLEVRGAGLFHSLSPCSVYHPKALPVVNN